MPEKNTKKKTAPKPEDKEDILEKIEAELSENLEEPENKEEKPGQEIIEEVIIEEKDSTESSKSNDSIFSTPPEDSKPPKKGMSMSFIIIVICLCVIFLLAGFVGGYFYGKGLTINSEPSTKDSIVETPTPTPTVEEVDLSAYSIEILNGSGVAGVAADEQDALEADGFSVGNTGNAETQDFAETSISFKSDVPEEFLDKLKESLAARYVIAEDAGELDSDNTYDVVITLGSETVADE